MGCGREPWRSRLSVSYRWRVLRTLHRASLAFVAVERESPCVRVGAHGSGRRGGEVFHHFPGGHAIVDGRIVGNESDTVSHFCSVCLGIEAVYGHATGGWFEEGAEDTEGSRLPAAVGAKQSKDLARFGCEGDISIARYDPVTKSGYDLVS